MKKRPLSIILVTLICLSAGPFYLAYQLWMQRYDPYASIMTLNPLHLVIAVLAFPVGIGIFRVQNWGYFSFIAYAITLVSYFLYEYFTSPVIYNYVLLVGSVFMVGGLSFIIQHHVSAPYFNPRLKWWERDPRYRSNLHADFCIDGDIRKGSLLDLSLSGCYANIESKLSAGDTVKVDIRLLDHHIHTTAKVIWANPEGGYGVMFMDLAHQEKRELKNMIDYLLSSGMPVIDEGVPESNTQTEIAI